MAKVRVVAHVGGGDLEIGHATPELHVAEHSLQLQRMLGHMQFGGGVADFQVAAAHVRDHPDLGHVSRRSDRLLVGTRTPGAALAPAHKGATRPDPPLASGPGQRTHPVPPLVRAYDQRLAAATP
ncbi:hypothetical protein BU225_20010, partial [Stenotrophomonas sp. MB339]